MTLSKICSTAWGKLLAAAKRHHACTSCISATLVGLRVSRCLRFVTSPRVSILGGSRSFSLKSRLFSRCCRFRSTCRRLTPHLAGLRIGGGITTLGQTLAHAIRSLTSPSVLVQGCATGVTLPDEPPAPLTCNICALGASRFLSGAVARTNRRGPTFTIAACNSPPPGKSLSNEQSAQI